jgi:hypothetical protein
MSAAPQWLRREVSRGLQALVALSLKRSPPADTIAQTLDVWLVPIAKRLGGMDEARGAKRVRGAFEALFSRREWPCPADFFDALPAPEPLPSLPAPRLTDEERARNRARIAEIIRRLNEKQTAKDDYGRK